MEGKEKQKEKKRKIIKEKMEGKEKQKEKKRKIIKENLD